MKKVYILLENYFNGAIWEGEQIWRANEYAGIFPTWEKAYNAICQKREKQVEEAKEKSIPSPSPIKEEFGFTWTWEKDQEEGWEEEWRYEIKEDELEEE